MWLWWLALPTILRRLIGAVVVLAVTAGALALWHHRAFTSGYDAGHRAGADSAWLADTRKQQIALDSMEARADSMRYAARHSESMVNAASRKGLAMLTATPHVRVDTVAITVPDSVPMVSVFVESDSASYPAHPRLAALLVWQDSLIHQVAVPLIARQQAVIAQLDTALTAEHDARLGADSLGAQWRERALKASPPKGMSWTAKVLHTLVWTTTVLVVAKRVHLRL